jgi:hypothetical protein
MIQCIHHCSLSCATTAAWRLSITNNKPVAHVGLWDYTVQVPGLTSDEDDAVFFPIGYGIQQFNAPVTIASSIAGSYPSNGATMQFMAAGGGQAAGNAGVYVGAHDPGASMKTVFAAVYPQSDQATSEHAFAMQDVVKTHEHLRYPGDASESGSPAIAYAPSVALGFTITAMNAGLAFTTYEQDFDIVVGLTASAPLWFAAAQIYREWALASAPWLSAGPVVTRPDMPTWYLQNNLWLNTGWQCLDIFNETQGDPDVVGPRVQAMRFVCCRWFHSPSH